jgi:hypothetical protein
LPALSAKDLGQPFPCRNHPCGCQNAEQCWRNCCCFTPEEKLAWAEVHGIVPPPYAEQPQVGGWNVPRSRDLESTSQSSHTHCTDCERSKSVQAIRGLHKRSCCSKNGCCSSDGDNHPTSPSTNPNRLILGALASHCQNLPTLWLTTGAVPPPTIPVACTHYWPALGWLSDDNPSTARHFTSLIEPPPRLDA